jgi:hypothetical protein
MAYANESKKPIIITGVREYIDRQNLRKNTTASIDEFGNLWRFIDGVKISEKEFKALYPVILPYKSRYEKGEPITNSQQRLHKIFK